MNWREPLGIRGTRHEGRKYTPIGLLSGIGLPCATFWESAIFWESVRVGAVGDPTRRYGLFGWREL